MITEAFEGVAIEKLTSSKQIAVDGGQAGILANLLPMFGDGRDLVFDQSGGFGLFQVIVGRGSEQGGERAGAVLAFDEHGLRGFTTGAALRADVIGRRECQHPAVPEGGVVASMVVGIAAQHVEANPPVDLARHQRLNWPPSGSELFRQKKTATG